jgi:CRP/FNR family transcriptional activator FtrB
VVKAQKDLKLRSSLERLANYLLRQQGYSGGEASFELPFEKRRMASLLGMTPENLSRAFKSLQGYGVSVDGNRVQIDQQATLEAFAKPNALIDDYSS